MKNARKGENAPSIPSPALRAICAGNRYLHRVQAYANGTHVLTVKRARSA